MRKDSIRRGALMLFIRYACAFLIIGLLWEAASRAAGESLLPSPVTTAALFFQSLSDPGYLEHMGVSLKRLVYGLTAGAVPALLLGLLLGHMKKADWLGAPLVYTTFPLPKIVLLPVFFLFLGLSDDRDRTGFGASARSRLRNSDHVYGSGPLEPHSLCVPTCGFAGVLDKPQGGVRHGRGSALFGRELCHDYGVRVSDHGCLGRWRYACDVQRHSRHERDRTSAVRGCLVVRGCAHALVPRSTRTVRQI